MQKSETQRSVDNAHAIIRSTVQTNPTYVQETLSAIAWEYFNAGETQWAYDLINEAFSRNHIAGYKYSEWCKRLGMRGEFEALALANPLINL